MAKSMFSKKLYDDYKKREVVIRAISVLDLDPLEVISLLESVIQDVKEWDTNPNLYKTTSKDVDNVDNVDNVELDDVALTDGVELKTSQDDELEKEGDKPSLKELGWNDEDEDEDEVEKGPSPLFLNGSKLLTKPEVVTSEIRKVGSMTREEVIALFPHENNVERQRTRSLISHLLNSKKLKVNSQGRLELVNP